MYQVTVVELRCRIGSAIRLGTVLDDLVDDGRCHALVNVRDTVEAADAVTVCRERLCLGLGDS